jgi:MoxR-like ATPase
MTSYDVFKLYEGDGTSLAERGLSLPPFESLTELNDPSGYLAEKGLRDAVNVSIALGQPLLVTGEPGTGKTRLADSVAYELGLLPPFVFFTKTTSTAKDLFYRYDALQRFHDAQFSTERLPPDKYITYEALGLAILLSLKPEAANAYLPQALKDNGPIRSVVLVDEIDKAPRDFPNDILNEVENLSFTVHESGRQFATGQGYRPILILTSNSERNLPDAFVRRCVFYHIPFPDTEQLVAIIQRRLRLSPDFTPGMLLNAVQHFEKIRDLTLKKKPATAELLAWVRIIDKIHLDVNDLKPGEMEALLLSYSILAKSKEDKEMITQALH